MYTSILRFYMSLILLNSYTYICIYFVLLRFTCKWKQSALYVALAHETSTLLSHSDICLLGIKVGVWK